jgi:hypothetical protein
MSVPLMLIRIVDVLLEVVFQEALSKIKVFFGL